MKKINSNKPTVDQNINEILNNQKLRKSLAFKSHFWFFHIYLSHYVKFETAPFQKEMFAITEDDNIQRAVIVAFRSSAKSTIFSLSYPLWAMLGKQQKKFIILLSQTSNQAKMILKNIRREIEVNDLIRKDFGKLDAQADEWKSNSIVISKYDTRILAASTGESIRGIRHRNFRPDLIICDDVEDLPSVKTKDARDKTSDWLRGEVIPAGNENPKLIMAGNLLHEDSLMVRLRNAISKGEFSGIFRKYPLVDDENNILWPGRFPDFQEIEKLRKSVGDKSAWYREYLLKIISDVDRVVHPDWIHYYDELPKNYLDDLEFIATGIDLAISQKETSNFTAMVSAYVLNEEEDDLRIYICPNPVNERLTFPQTVERAKSLSTSLGKGQQTLLYAEEVGYQRAFIERLNEEGFQAEGVKPRGQDKRARLTLTTALIQNGTVVFPRKGAEELIRQLIDFGVEKHDDLADAFSLLILKIMEDLDSYSEPEIYIVDLGSSPTSHRPLSLD